MMLRCEDCRHEIKAEPVREERRCFCDARCRELFRRRLARFRAEQKPLAFGDA
jgi:hypothetical protein